MKLFIIASLCSMAYAPPALGAIVKTTEPPDVWPGRNPNCLDQEFKSFPYWAPDKGVYRCFCPSTAFIDKDGFCRSCPRDIGWANRENNASSCKCRDGFTWIEEKNTCECIGSNPHIVENKCIVDEIPPDVYPNRNRNCENEKFKSFPYYATNKGILSCFCPSTAFIDKNGFCRSCPRTIGLANSEINASACKCFYGFTWIEEKNTCECIGSNPHIVENRCIPDVYPYRDPNCVDEKFKSFPYWATDKGVSSCVCPKTAFLDKRGNCRACGPGTAMMWSNNASYCICRDGFTWNAEKNTCECTGPDRRILQNECRQCPDANVVTNNYFVDANDVCKKCPTDAMVTNGSCQCPGEKWKNPSTGYCPCIRAPYSTCICILWAADLDKTGPVPCAECSKWIC